MSNANFTLTVERLRVVLNYDTETGKFTRKISSGGAVVGSTPGAIDSRGYTQIRIDKRLYLAHRLAWMYVTGEWPETIIDHINGNKLDNRFCNLRQVNKAENCQNRRRASKDSKTGFLGVTQTKYGYVAAIWYNGASLNLGTYETPSLAQQVYVHAKRQLHVGNTL